MGGGQVWVLLDVHAGRLARVLMLRVGHLKWILTFPKVEAEAQYFVRPLETLKRYHVL